MSSAPSSQDPFYIAKRGTYKGFLRFSVATLVIVLLIVAGMAIFLV